MDKEYKIVDACTVLTKGIADAAAGGRTARAAVPVNTSTDDITVSSCTYIRDTNVGLPVSVASIKTVSLLARNARTQAGVSSNKQQFGTGKPAGVRDVARYGQAAYWDGERGQLHILNNNNWYIVTNGSGSITARTVEDAEKLANQIIRNL